MALKTFEVVDGFHYGPTDKTIPKTQAVGSSRGQLVESEHDLDLAFPNKFRRVASPVAASGAADDDAGPLGKDVTGDYPKAVEQDYKVFLHKGLCTIYDGDALALGVVKPLNANPVPTDQVDVTVAKLVRSQPA